MAATAAACWSSDPSDYRARPAPPRPGRDRRSSVLQLLPLGRKEADQLRRFLLFPLDLRLKVDQTGQIDKDFHAGERNIGRQGGAATSGPQPAGRAAAIAGK